jgi:hypothetical protein
MNLSKIGGTPNSRWRSEECGHRSTAGNVGHLEGWVQLHQELHRDLGEDVEDLVPLEFTAKNHTDKADQDVAQCLIDGLVLLNFGNP